MSLYHLYIHGYINHANVAWSSTFMSSVYEKYNYQKPAIHITYNKKRSNISESYLEKAKF